MSDEHTVEHIPAWYQPVENRDRGLDQDDGLPRALAWPEPTPLDQPPVAAPEPELTFERPHPFPTPGTRHVIPRFETPRVTPTFDTKEPPATFQTVHLSPAIESLQPAPPPPQAPAAAPDAFTRHADTASGAPAPVYELPQPVVTLAAVPRPYGTPMTNGVTSGGPGWNIRSAAVEQNAEAAARAPTFTIAAVAEPAAPAPWDEPRARQRNPLVRYAVFGVALFALCGGSALVLTSLGHQTPSLSQPASVGELTSMNDSQSNAVLQPLTQQLRNQGATQVVAGVYGTGGQPDVLLMAVKDPELSNGGTQGGFNQFSRGFAGGVSSAGGKFDATHLSTTSLNGAIFGCAPMTSVHAPGVSLSTCVWTETGIAGVVVDLGGQSLPDALNEAVQARSAAEH